MSRQVSVRQLIVAMAVIVLVVGAVVVASQSYTGVEAKASSQVLGASRWEYKVVDILKIEGGLSDATKYEAAFNSLGLQSWELAGGTANILVFKRPAQ